MSATAAEGLKVEDALVKGGMITAEALEKAKEIGRAHV